MLHSLIWVSLGYFLAVWLLVPARYNVVIVALLVVVSTVVTLCIAFVQGDSIAQAIGLVVAAATGAQLGYLARNLSAAYFEDPRRRRAREILDHHGIHPH